MNHVKLVLAMIALWSITEKFNNNIPNIFLAVAFIEGSVFVIVKIKEIIWT